MFITKSTLEELNFYLKSFRQILKEKDLSKPLFPSGVTVGKIAYHTIEATNYWLQTFILGKEYPRNKDRELIDQHSFAEITKGLNHAIKLCEEIPKRKIKIDTKLRKPRKVQMGFAITNFYEVLLHVTAHTAEHLAHISIKVKG